MITIEVFAFNPFQENTYLLYDETKECIIIDPGCFDQAERFELSDFIESNDLKVVKIVNTHCHIDHIAGVEYVKDKYKVPFFIPKGEEPIYKACEVYGEMYGFVGLKMVSDFSLLQEGDKVRFGNSTLDILHCPGHAPGHLVFVEAKQNFCIAGDVLFRESIGRTDLPGGNHAQLISSIQQKMFALDNNMEVHCGHGPSTTIGHEKVNNPYCATGL